MLPPQVPMSIFILSFKSRWHCLVDGTGAGEQLTAEARNKEPVRSSPAREGCGVTMQAAVSIVRLASTNGQRPSLRAFDISIRQGPHEGDDGILLILAEAEIAELSHVQVFGDFRRGP